MHGCDPGRVSDGSRLASYQTLSIDCPSSIFFLAGIIYCYYWSFLFVVSVFVSLLCFLLLSLELCRCSSDLFYLCPADHVPDWQPRILLGMVEARSVNNVKKTTAARRVENTFILKVGEVRSEK